jgi:hypothetical protein
MDNLFLLIAYTGIICGILAFLGFLADQIDNRK